jgi:hypothetical protein
MGSGLIIYASNAWIINPDPILFWSKQKKARSGSGLNPILWEEMEETGALCCAAEYIANLF